MLAKLKTFSLHRKTEISSKEVYEYLDIIYI